MMAFFKTTQSDKIDVSSIETLSPIEHRTDEEVFWTPFPYHESSIFFPEVNLLFLIHVWAASI